MPIDPHSLLLFLVAGLALNFTPGADMLYCLGQGMRGGPRIGVAAALGIGTGGCIHVVGAAAGLSALLLANPTAFEAVRWAGVAYLVWIAIRSFTDSGGRLAPPPGEAERTAYEAWRDGTLVNLLNPKVFVFVMAFLPQFVDPARASAALQVLLLGTIFNITGTMVNAAVGGFAGSIGRSIATSPRAARWLGRGSGVIFLALAARLALEKR